MCIRDSIRADRAPPGLVRSAGVGDARPLLDEADDSLRAHSCHGRARQVEVVREAVLHLLAADPTLEPRDVIIMCPDIEPVSYTHLDVYKRQVLATAPCSARPSSVADSPVKPGRPRSTLSWSVSTDSWAGTLKLS